MAHFNVGDTVWLAKCRTEQVSVQCPVCFGTRQVTIILGDGTHVELACGYCGHERPSGVVREYKYLTDPECKIVESVYVEQKADGESVRYGFYGGWNGDQHNVFATKEEAQVACDAQAVKHEGDWRANQERIKADQNKTYAWNAGYHMREAKEHERQLEYHRNAAKVCKERAKKPK
ncbi:MAG: hypothetical protein WC114_02750 [Smithellaceae bacterium]|jgi:hypothetical protein